MLAVAGAREAAPGLRPGSAEPGILPVACKVADEASVTAALTMAEAAHGVARVVVTCAGIPGSMRLAGRDGPVAKARFGQVIRVKLMGSVSAMTKTAAFMMPLDLPDPDDQCGVIVNTASTTALESHTRQGAHVAFTGAIAAMMIQTAREFAVNHAQAIKAGRSYTDILQGLEVPRKGHPKRHSWHGQGSKGRKAVPRSEADMSFAHPQPPFR